MLTDHCPTCPFDIDVTKVFLISNNVQPSAPGELVRA